MTEFHTGANLEDITNPPVPSRGELLTEPLRIAVGFIRRASGLLDGASTVVRQTADEIDNLSFAIWRKLDEE
jgi:hypothetical protein